MCADLVVRQGDGEGVLFPSYARGLAVGEGVCSGNRLAPIFLSPMRVLAIAQPPGARRAG